MQQVCVAAAVQLGGKPVCGQIPSGGGNGFGLDVKAQPPARPARQTAQKRRISAVAAGGIHQQLRVLQPGCKEVLHELHSGQVRRPAAAEPPGLLPEAELCPERFLPRHSGQRSRENGGRLPVISAKAAQYLF